MVYNLELLIDDGAPSTVYFYNSMCMEKKQKRQYAAPAIEVIAMENEGVIASSGITESMTPVGNQSVQWNSASSSDLEDMINDILTTE